MIVWVAGSELVDGSMYRGRDEREIFFLEGGEIEWCIDRIAV